MPLYDVLLLVKGSLPRPQLEVILRKAATAVFDSGGIITDIRSYGLNQLAYQIRKSGELHSEARQSSAGTPARDRRLCKAI